MCVYVKDTSRSTETGSVCVCVIWNVTSRSAEKDTSRSTETGVCVCV